MGLAHYGHSTASGTSFASLHFVQGAPQEHFTASGTSFASLHFVQGARLGSYVDGRGGDVKPFGGLL